MVKPAVKKIIPFEFILDELSSLELYRRPMFGLTGVYVGDKIMLILCKKEGEMKVNNGIWLCIPDEHVVEMKQKFPMLRGVSFFENENSVWQVLPESESDFEELSLQICSMIKKHSPMIGRIPKPKKLKTKKTVKKKKATGKK